jgi:adhesin/invasin
VRFLTRAEGMTWFLTDSENVMVLSRRKKDFESEQAVVRMKFEGAAVAQRLEGLDKAASVSNYFIGNEPSSWRPGVSNYHKVKAWGLYPGIDVVYYGNARKLEYDFVVAPGADPARIRLSFKGADRLTTDESGNLIVSTAAGALVQRKPVVYQEYGGARHVIEAGYTIRGGNVEFALADWDRGKELVIDPTLVYSTFLAGNYNDEGFGIAVDSSGNAYVAGDTTSTDFPTTPGSIQPNRPGGKTWVFVTKLNATGGTLLYSTYLGGTGSNDNSTAYGIAIDPDGNAHVTGSTSSSDFPTTMGAYRASSAGSAEAFVTKLNSDGSALVYSTYLGGSGIDNGRAIALDSSRAAYVTGDTTSDNFPVTPGAFQPTRGGKNYPAAFVTKLNPSGTALEYSTYVGGEFNDWGYGIAVDGGGNAYVAGATYSLTFPTTPGAFQPAHAGGSNQLNAVVFKMNPTGSGLVYSTYLGSPGTSAYAIAVDSSGFAYVTGTAAADFAVTPAAFQRVFGGNSDAFVTKLNASGTALVYSTYLGGRYQEIGYGIAINASGEAHITGILASVDFPVTGCAYQAELPGGAQEAAFVSKLNAAGTGLAYSTYLGGRYTDRGNALALDSSGAVYVTGNSRSPDFPNTIGTPFKGHDIAFVTKIGFGQSAPGSSIAPVGGASQSATVDTEFPSSLQVRVTDASGNPACETTVSFTAPSTGASATLVPTSAVTDANGLAEVTATANAIAGSYAVTASLSGSAATATFNLTNIAAGAQTIAFIQQPADTAAGAVIPLVTVRLTDSLNNPIANTAITVSLQGGTAQLIGTLTQPTNSSGVATFGDLKINTAGTYQLQATGGSLTTTSTPFTIAAGSAISITAASGGGQSAGAGAAYASPLRALVHDAFNNPIQGVSVTFTAPAGGATVSFSGSPTVNTDVNGIATSPAMTASGQTGTFSVNASTTGAAAPAVFSLTITAGSANKLGFVQQPTDSAAGTVITPPVTVQLQDSFGNPVRTAGVQVALQLVPVNAQVSRLSTIPPQLTDPNGLATFATLTVEQAGQYQLAASSTGVASATSSMFIVRAGSPAAITATGGTPQSTPVLMPFPQPLEATVRDAFGNPVSSVAVSFSAPATGASAALSGATAATDAGGHARVTATANGLAGSYTVNAVAGSLGPIHFALTNIAGAAAQIAFAQQPSNTAAGSAISPPVSVQVLDAGGNPVNEVSVTLQLGEGTGTLDGTLTRTTGPSGLALFNDLTISTVGTYRLNATSLAGSVLSNPFDMTPAAAITISIASGDRQTAPVGTAYPSPLRASVQDTFGNPVGNSPVTFAAPSSGASVIFDGPATVNTDASGIATAPAITANDTVGAVSVTASTTEAPSPATFVLINVAGSANKLGFLQQPSDTAAGATITPPVTVHLQDTFGNAVRMAGVPVTLQLNPVQAKLRTARAIEPQNTDSNGVATFAALKVELAGQYTLLASAPDIASVTSNPFIISAVTGTGSMITAAGGTPQSATIQAPFSQPLQAAVRDAFGNPLSGVTVTFSAPGAGASAILIAGSAVTNAGGLAMVTATANGVAGAYEVIASAAGVTGSATFLLTNTPGTAGRIAFVQQPSNTQAGAPISPPVVVRLADAANNALSGMVVTMSLSGGVTLGGTVSATTNAAGEATFDDLHVNTTGAYQLTAVSGSRSAISDPFQVSPAQASHAISVYEGNGQIALTGSAFGAPLKARVQDLFGNPLPGIPVTFTAPSSGASLTFAGTTTVTTDAGGIAISPTMTANTIAGAYAATATTPNAPSPASFTLTNAQPSANKLAFLQHPSDTPAGAIITPPVTVRLQDSSGAPLRIAGVTVTLQPSVPAQRVSAFSNNRSQTTDENGVAAFDQLSGVRAGTYELQANANIVASATSIPFQIIPGIPASIVASGGTPQGTIINTMFGEPLQVTVTDAARNPVPGVPVVFLAPSLGPSGSFAGQSTMTVNTDTLGHASAMFTANSIAGTYSVSASSPAITGTAVFSLTNLPAGAGSLAFAQQPSNTQIGQAITPSVTVQVRDISGSAVRVAGLPIAVSLSEGAGQLSGTRVQLTDTGGIATFADLRLNQSGAKRLRAISPQQAPANSNNFEVTSAAPSSIVVFAGSPQATTVLQEFQSLLRAQVRDAGGFPAVGVSVTFLAPAAGPSGAFAGSATVTTDGNGVATAPILTANSQPGNFVVTAATPGVTSSALFALTNLPQQSSTLVVAPGNLYFTSEIGQPPPPGQTVRITTTGGQAVDWTATPSAPWLAALPASGTTPGEIAVTVNPAGLVAGTHTGNILITSPGSNVAVVLVTYTISDKPALVIAPPTLVFSTTSNTIVPAPQSLQARSSSRPIQYNVTAQVSTPSGGAWLQVTPGQGTTPGTVIVNANPAGLSNGVYDGSVLFTPTESGLNQVAVPVTLIVGCGQGGCQTQPSIIAVVNAASFQPGGTPRAILTIFGRDLSDAIYESTTNPLAGRLGPTSVTVNQVPAPLFYASPTQINFQMPSTLSTTDVVVTVTNTAAASARAARSSPSYGVTLTAVHPGVFLGNKGRAAALNGDLSLHTAATPILTGSYVILYLTGEGSVSPPASDGVAAPSSPLSLITAQVQVTIGGKASQVTYQGVAPGFAGLAQLNVIVPAGLTPGDQPVFVTMDGVPSNVGLITVR